MQALISANKTTLAIGKLWIINMTTVKDTIALLKARGMWSDKIVEGKNYKPLPTFNKKTKKVQKQDLPI